MAYKALYRKYRPDNFEKVVGQKSIVLTLQNAVKNNKISHAYLFSGPRGTGKTSIAKIFAKTINCLDSKDGLPCGNCEVCKQFSNDQITDIIEIDAASNNGVDEIRDLKSKINLAPTFCKYKVYIIDEVHMLSIGAFNALLKTLEEPPSHAVFILATTEMHKLPLTIISRCQNYNFKKITEKEMEERLSYIAKEEGIEINELALSEIAKLADGGMRDAIGLLEQANSFSNGTITLKDIELISSNVPQSEIANLLLSIYESNVEDIFKKIDGFYQEGKDFVRIAEDLVLFLKDCVLYRKAKKYFLSVSRYNSEENIKFFDKLQDNFIYNAIREMNISISDLKISSHPRTIFEISILKLLDGNIKIENDHASKDCKEEKNIDVVGKECKVDKNIDVASKSDSTDDIRSNEIKIEKTIVEDKEKIKSEQKEITDDADDFLPLISLKLHKKVLINNTLALADKKLLKDINEKCLQLSTFLINKDFKQAASILLDGKIVGASSNNIIVTYDYEAIVDKADDMIVEIENLFDNMLGQRFKIINVTNAAWSDIRPYFVKLLKDNGKIEILPEPVLSEKKTSSKPKKRSKEIDDAINIFGEDIIEIK